MQREVNNGRKPWNVPKLQRLPASNAEGSGGTKGDGQLGPTRAS